MLTLCFAEESTAQELLGSTDDDSSGDEQSSEVAVDCPCPPDGEKATQAMDAGTSEGSVATAQVADTLQGPVPDSPSQLQQGQCTGDLFDMALQSEIDGDPIVGMQNLSYS